uniref:Uncharacterized protein n=1 Tax=Ovis aries TaxID=9940 RepID=A0AC11DJV5_SHEEP
MANRRALHFVFKGNRFETACFYRDVLGMKFVLNMLCTVRGKLCHLF